MSKTKKQIFRFIISGICAVVTDMLFYYILSAFIELSLAKGISFLIGTITAYLLNKYFTFQKKEKSYNEIIKFVILYTTSLTANITVNRICFIILPFVFKHIYFLDNNKIIKLLAFFFATGTSTIINFLGQKFWVFNSKNGENINEQN